MTEDAAQAAVGWGIRLEVVKLSTTKRGFVLLPRRWVVKRTQGSALSAAGAGLRTVARDARGIASARLVSLMVQKVVSFLVGSS
jgi:hypothetical protein